MAWPGTNLHTELLLVNSQCLYPNVCCAHICAAWKILGWRTEEQHYFFLLLLRSMFQQSDQVCHCMDCAVPSIVQKLLLWGASICECSFSHSTSRPGFQKIEAEHLWKEETLESPQTVYSDINCDSLKNVIQYFYRRLFFFNLTIFVLLNLYQMWIWKYFSLISIETSWVSL